MIAEHNLGDIILVLCIFFSGESIQCMQCNTAGITFKPHLYICIFIFLSVCDVTS